VAVGKGPGFLVAGSSGGTAAVWSSPDGRRWQPAPPLPGGRGAGAAITSLATSDSGEEWAAGVVNGVARVWGSGDGRRWASVALPAMTPPARGAVVRAVTVSAGADQLLVVVQSSKGSVAARVAIAALATPA
jgi:hypothetical protein